MNRQEKVRSFLFLATVILLVFISYKIAEKNKPPTLVENSCEYLVCKYQKVQLHKEEISLKPRTFKVFFTSNIPP